VINQSNCIGGTHPIEVYGRSVLKSKGWC